MFLFLVLVVVLAVLHLCLLYPAFGGSDSKAIEAFKDDNQKQEQQQKQKPRSLRLVQKYDAPFPDGFNDHPSEAGVRFRFEWCEAHRLDKGKEPAPAPVNDEPLEDEFEEPAGLYGCRLRRPHPPVPRHPPPTTMGRSKPTFQCPACDYSHKAGYGIAGHIQERHPDSVSIVFPLNAHSATGASLGTRSRTTKPNVTLSWRSTLRGNTAHSHPATTHGACAGARIGIH